jgi:hypothetical protein
MEPARILVENSRFQPLTPVISSTANRVETDNGWTCYIKASGTIVCEARRMYSDGEYAITYIIKSNGFFTVTKETPKNGGTRKVTNKGFICEKGTETPTNGVLNLTGGNINTRKCYFRSKFFDKWLEENNLKSIRNMISDGQYSVNVGNEILTDGDFTDVEVLDDVYRIEVKNSTWVRVNDSEGFGILYTTADVLNISFEDAKSHKE